MLPLTHHDILAISAPFVRRGRHVDLAATERSERRIAFAPRERGALVELLALHDAVPARCRLIRTLRRGDGVEAVLEAEGPAPERLLDQVDAVDPDVHFTEQAGCVIARDYRLQAAVSPLPVVTRLSARLPSATLTVTVPARRADPAAVELLPADGMPLQVPQDLLAVLGTEWTPLRPVEGAWRGSLKLPRREPERSRRAEYYLERAVSHVHHTLAEAPHRYHERWAVARWRVYGRRALPLLGCFLLIGATAALPRMHLSEHSAVRMLIFNAPPLLLGLFFCLREIPRIELPPLPRRPPAAAWREAGTT